MGLTAIRPAVYARCMSIFSDEDVPRERDLVVEDPVQSSQIEVVFDASVDIIARCDQLICVCPVGSGQQGE